MEGVHILQTRSQLGTYFRRNSLTPDACSPDNFGNTTVVGYTGQALMLWNDS